MATALPPTTHALPQTQRANLIRTTRKLGAILGETPLVVEPPRSHHAHTSSVSSIESTASKRSGRIFADPIPRGPSLAAMGDIAATTDAATSGATAPADRPLLLLRLPQTGRPRPLSNISINSPLSPSIPRSPPVSPMTPTIVVDRRKKMAKLVRTLGTNVPPELVFAAPSRSAMIPSPIVVPAILTALAPQHNYSVGVSPVSPRPSTSASLRRRKSDESLASATREAFGSPFPSQYLAPSPRHASNGDERVDLAASSAPPSPRSPHYLKATSPTWNASTDDLHDSYAAHASTASCGASDTRFFSRHVEFRADTPFSDVAGEAEEAVRSTYRREQGWSGEWTGAGGMDDVVNRLRGLRLK